MPLLIRNLALSLDEPEDGLVELAARRLRVPASAIQAWSIAQRAIDARRGEVHLAYNLEIALSGGAREEHERTRRLHRPDIQMLEAKEATRPEPGSQPLHERPVIIGFGPAGMFAALRLAQWGYRPIVLERGREVRRRHRDIMHRFYRLHEFDPESNLLFGEGGAGTYSDGKLYTRIHDPLCREVMETFYRHGADPDILISSRPHIGSDRLPTLCTRIRHEIESLGGEVRFECHVDDIEFVETSIDHGPAARRIHRLHVRSQQGASGGEWLACGPVVLAVGHSARDTVRMLVRHGVAVDPKPFQIGVRIEHPQALVDRWQFGAAAGHARLGSAEYHLVAKGAACERGDLFSFCMCPGGIILPTNETHGLIATNGASRANRSSPFANSGFVITMDPATLGMSALDGISFQEQWERRAFAATGGSYEVPAQRASDFLAGRAPTDPILTSYPLGTRAARVAELVPQAVTEALTRGLPTLDRRLPGLAGDDAVITAPETRASAPFRITRKSDSRESISVADLCPVGEGAGYAGGIVSAAVDGIRSADAIIRRYRPRP